MKNFQLHQLQPEVFPLLLKHGGEPVVSLRILRCIYRQYGLHSFQIPHKAQECHHRLHFQDVAKHIFEIAIVMRKDRQA